MQRSVNMNNHWNFIKMRNMIMKMICLNTALRNFNQDIMSRLSRLGKNLSKLYQIIPLYIRFWQKHMYNKNYYLHYMLSLLYDLNYMNLIYNFTWKIQ